MKHEHFNIIFIFGPTASGKTKKAVEWAYTLDTEIISADSRQVYKGLDIGTGKDLNEYNFQNKSIPYHLIDCCPAGEDFMLDHFVKRCFNSINEIQQKGKIPIVCGGTALYFDTLLNIKKWLPVPKNIELEIYYAQFSDNHLQELWKEQLHDNKNLFTGIHLKADTRKRIIRALTVADYLKSNEMIKVDFPKLNPLFLSQKLEAEDRKKSILHRLDKRFADGMIAEVENLIQSGISADWLIRLGLEYKYITLFLQQQLTFVEMKKILGQSIIQFSKRQMTWLRKFEREYTVVDINQLNPEKYILL